MMTRYFADRNVRCTMAIRTACLWMMASGFTCLAQNQGVQGLVTDPSAAAVPGVTVTITNVATGIVSVAQTNEQGLFSAPFLAVGTYRVVAEKTGFSPVTRENLNLNVNQIARV